MTVYLWHWYRNCVDGSKELSIAPELFDWRLIWITEIHEPWFIPIWRLDGAQAIPTVGASIVGPIVKAKPLFLRENQCALLHLVDGWALVPVLSCSQRLFVPHQMLDVLHLVKVCRSGGLYSRGQARNDALDIACHFHLNAGHYCSLFFFCDSLIQVTIPSTIQE